MDLSTTICPRCGAAATLLQVRETVDEVPNLGAPTAKDRLPVKVEEFRCQNPSCEHEFERIVRESTL